MEAKCYDGRPGGPPVLLNAIPGDKSVTLRWTEAPDPVSYYLVRYGLSKGNFEYGQTNIGPKGTTSYTIYGLENGKKYYFQVRAGNGCRPGEFSNTLTAVPGSHIPTPIKMPNLSIYKQVLGTSSDDQLKKEKIASNSSQVVASTDGTYCATDCNSEYLLAVEAIALIAFFLLAFKFPILQPVYSIFIPVVTIGTFYYFQQCSSYAFYCKYFLSLSIIIYISLLVAFKNRSLHYHAAIKRLFID